MKKKSIAYNIPIVYYIKSQIDINALQQAFNSIINKYESFRTYFIEIDGEPKQGILENVNFNIDVVEINGNRDLFNDTKELIQKVITTPFNLEEAPLIKVTLLKNSNIKEYILIINVHHIVLDEWSINILAENLAVFLRPLFK